MADHLRSPSHRPHPAGSDDDEPLVDPGRSLVLRLLALLGAFSFLMIGLSSLVPLLRPPTPPSIPGQRGVASLAARWTQRKAGLHQASRCQKPYQT
jgi:hypothetical protein